MARDVAAQHTALATGRVPMMRTFLVLVLLGACSDPSHEMETARDAGPDATIDADPTDADGDGVRDSDDNCPYIANALQNDEDSDDVGDACDRCPVSADDTDRDNDGVGDACDPNPDVGGDRIVLFEGFAGTALPTGWHQNAEWTFGNGKATTSVTSLASIGFPVANVKLTTSTSIRLTQYSLSASAVFGLVQNTDSDLLDGAGCYLQYFNDDPQNRVVRVTEFPVAALDYSVGTDVAAGVNYRLDQRRSDHAYGCDVAPNGMSVSGTASNPNVAAP
ncbi:MAG: thrombospondin type 3 repeat-containing protein, partial [Haliangium ochraceum]